jgi:hypothetical protein
MLCLWLSIIVIVPFDIETMDSNKGGEQYETLVKRILNIGQDYIMATGKISDFASVMVSKLLTRPDVIKLGVTESFLKKMAASINEFKEETDKMFAVTGILLTLTEVFKIGHREDFLSLVPIVFDPIIKCEIKNKFMA